MGNWFSCFTGRKPKDNLKGDECNGDGDFRIPVERANAHNRLGNFLTIELSARFLKSNFSICLSHRNR